MMTKRTPNTNEVKPWSKNKKKKEKQEPILILDVVTTIPTRVPFYLDLNYPIYSVKSQVKVYNLKQKENCIRYCFEMYNTINHRSVTTHMISHCSLC